MDNTKYAIKEQILNLLKEENLTYEQLRDKLIQKMGWIDQLELREIISDMIRKGEILKIPDYTKNKFIFKAL
jgi:hypothetical protein